MQKHQWGYKQNVEDTMTKMKFAVAALAATIIAGPVMAAGAPEIVTIVKLTGINWFNRMEEGVKEFGATGAAVTSQTGPATADAALQLKIIEDLVAKNVAAIAVVPNDPASLEPVLKRAIERGIKVVTHEADNQVNTQYDVEAFDNPAYGARLNQRMAECMKGEGKWSVFVGSLGQQTHNQWADGGIENAKANFPKLELVEGKQESHNDPDQAYAKALEILKKHPDIKGFQGSSSLDVIGIGRAIEEAGLQDKTCVFGTSLPSASGKLLATGAIDGISFWDPKDAGLVMNKVAKMLIDGKEVKDGDDLGVPGYNKVIVRQGPGAGKIILGQAWADVDKTNMDKYPF
jgi:simple sugar transport system substrate-binding protein